MIETPKKNGWYVSVITKDGKHIEDIITQKDCKTVDEVETYIEQTLNLKRAECKKWSFCECIY